MPTQQIPKERWSDFLDTFSAHNQTRMITVDLESTVLGPQRLIEHKPLLGIEPDLEEEAITVVAGDPEGPEPASLAHQVANPKAIWIKEDESGAAEALDIETEDGRTIIQFD